MILSWMIYAIAVGALLVVASTALDRIAVAREWPQRVVWAGTLAAALVWPGAIAARTLWPPLATPILPFAVTVAPLRTVASHDSGMGIAIDRAAIMTWIALSSLLLLRLIGDVACLRRLRRSWPLREIDGRLTRLTKEVGPAVIGLRTMEIVLPEWILTFEEPLRALVLCHEEEHRDARDPHLLIAARLATLIMPWNPAIWYAARRLRLAIELDCDARVLRAHPSAERYGMLLLTIAQRRGAGTLALAGNWAPRYPTRLRRAGIEGKVVAQFVVDRDGTVEMSSFKVLRSPDKQFTDVVKGALRSMRFSPAQVGGRPVRELVQMPFVFSLHE